MPGPPKRPSKKSKPTPPKAAPVPEGLPSSQHSDINDIVLSILPGASPDPETAPLSELAQNPWNPRYGYDDPKVKALAESLVQHGQIDRITVMPTALFLNYFPEYADPAHPNHKEIAASRWVITDGNRRYAAATLAELAELRISVAHTLVESAVEVRESVIIRSIHQEALPPLLEARELQALVAELGSQSKVAQRLGRTQGWVSQRLSLLRLAKPIQHGLAHGRVTIEHARAVAKIADQEKQEVVLRQLQAAAADAAAAPQAARSAEPDTSRLDQGAGAAKTGTDGGKQQPGSQAAGASQPRIRVDGNTVADLAQALLAKLDQAQLRELVELLSHTEAITA